MNIKVARVKAGLKQAELAQRIGVSSDTISRAERSGGIEPGLSTLRKIAAALDVSLSSLIGEDISGEALRIGERAERLRPEDRAFVETIINRLEMAE